LRMWQQEHFGWTALQFLIEQLENNVNLEKDKNNNFAADNFNNIHNNNYNSNYLSNNNNNSTNVYKYENSFFFQIFWFDVEDHFRALHQTSKTNVQQRKRKRNLRKN
jgi:hypothetical protein